MSKRPSLFADKAPKRAAVEFTDSDEHVAIPAAPVESEEPKTKRPPSREDKKILSVYLSKEAWRQLNRLAFDLERSKQSLGEEALELLFEKHRLNRIS